MQIRTDEVGGLGCRVSHPTGNLFTTGPPAEACFLGGFYVEQIAVFPGVVKRKERWRGIAFLFDHFGEIKTASEQPWRRSCFKTAQLDAGLD